MHGPPACVGWNHAATAGDATSGSSAGTSEASPPSRPQFRRRSGGVAATGPVGEIARYFHCRQGLSYALHVVADLPREEGGLGSGLTEDVAHGEVARG
jgi:hypothetical protein